MATRRVATENESAGFEDGESSARQSTGAGDFDTLAEVAAPAPIGRVESYRQHPHENTFDEGKAQVVAATTKRSAFWTETVTVAWLVFFSFFGTLARLGVEAISTYPYATVTSPVLWANMGGSFLFGFLLEDQRLFRYSAGPNILSSDKDETSRLINKSKKTFPLYVGLATGFCGCFTSFSTFITDAFLALSNSLPPADPSSPYHTVNPTIIQSRNGGYSFMAMLGVLIIHPSVSIGALKTGAHLAVGLEKVTPSIPALFTDRFLDPLAVALGSGCWLGAIFLSIWPPALDWRRRATMALVFAPLGTLLRFYASRYLNARVPAFPLGTFAVNVFGTCIAGMCYDLEHTYGIVGGVSSNLAASCVVLEGVVQGFCGCTTTVSTWVGELNGLRRRHAWLYGLASVGVALALQIAIMGSVAWTAGFDQSCGA